MGGFIAGLLIGAAGGMFVMAMAGNRDRSDDYTAGWNDCIEHMKKEG